jgi:hypothetical protein
MAKALTELLSRGYFPKELPPPFNTRSFGTAVEGGLPPEFDLLLTRPTKKSPAFVSQPSVHNLARAGTLRRKLSIPNPVNQYQIAAEVVRGWRQILRHCRKSPLSLTTPTFAKVGPGRAIAPAHEFPDIPLFRARTRAGCRFVLTTDLNAFYPSVYTHSVPWALHGKASAKNKRGDYSLLGNRLDLALRNAQAQQTIGIPIGPDTSLAVAEILAAAVDQRFPQYIQENAHRYIDDLECGFTHASEAESAVSSVQNAFAEFELSLNPRKTQVHELPLPLEAFWVPHLRLFPIGAKSQRTDLLGFFGRAFELAKANREEAILKYAVQRMRSVRISAANWPLYEDLLMNCLAVESGTTPSVVSELYRYRASHPLNRDRIARAFGSLINHHAPQHHGSEVAWSVWFLTDSGFRLPADTTKVALAMTDSIVALCLLHARSLGRVESGVDWAPLEALMTQDELLGPSWLVAYEAAIKGWLPSAGRRDHIAAIPQFDAMRAQNVSFYDTTAVLNMKPVRSSVSRESVAASESSLDSSLADFDLDLDEDDFASYVGASG